MMAGERLMPGWSLAELLTGFARIEGSAERTVTGLAVDSRTTRPGDLFFARRGLRTHGRDFSADAIRAGAVAVVAEGTAGAVTVERGVVRIALPDLPACLGALADRFHGRPSRRLWVAGVTGTNGKSSVSHYIAQALDAWDLSHADGGRCGLIGTLGHGFPGRLAAATHTTPDVLEVHRLLADMSEGGARHAVMEVSSHGLDQGRVAGVRFAAAVFTNLTRDHLDYHGDEAAYGAAKRRLFESPALRHAVINADDAFGQTLLATLPAGVQPLAFGLGARALPAEIPSLVGELLSADAGGLRLAVRGDLGEGELAAPLLGRFNASNLLAALGALRVAGMPMKVALARLAAVRPPAGRMQRFGGDGRSPLVVVDYAHTPDALDSALAALRPHCGGLLWCVFGCGGDRDRGKRALMGAVAERHADRVVLTDDNPRGEDGGRIVEDILSGVRRPEAVQVERDRAAAVRRVVHGAGTRDVVLVAGKGHETWQEIAGERRPFSDAAAVRSALGVEGS